MHSGYEIPRIQQQQEPRTHELLILEQICNNVNYPLTEQLFLQQVDHFLPTHLRQRHQYVTGSSSSDYLPVNFKLGVNEIRAPNDDEEDVRTVGVDVEDEGAFLCDPEERQNQQDPAIKLNLPFWELVTAQVYENSEAGDILEPLAPLLTNQNKETPNTCLESKSRQLCGEQEAMYERNQRDPTGTSPVETAHWPMDLDHGSDDSEDPSVSAINPKRSKKKKRRMKKRASTTYAQIINPMAQFFERLAKQVMDHQENLHKKFAQVVERMDEERRERDVSWRNQELAHFEEAATARARDKADAASREATIISYLEKISGQTMNATNTGDECFAAHDISTAWRS